MIMPSISFNRRLFRSSPWDASWKPINIPCMRWLAINTSGTVSQKVSKVQSGTQCRLSEKKNGREDRESRTAHPMGPMRFEQRFVLLEVVFIAFRS